MVQENSSVLTQLYLCLQEIETSPLADVLALRIIMTWTAENLHQHCCWQLRCFHVVHSECLNKGFILNGQWKQTWETETQFDSKGGSGQLVDVLHHWLLLLIITVVTALFFFSSLQCVSACDLLFFFFFFFSALIDVPVHLMRGREIKWSACQTELRAQLTQRVFDSSSPGRHDMVTCHRWRGGAC